MDRNTRHIIRLMFQNRIYQYDGVVFEDFFTRIMQCYNRNFHQVKPQGQYGDRKNDGFDSTTGTYYQVYAPEDIRIREKNTIEKLAVDFAGLYSHWQSITPIKRFFYVVNDKYKGVYPSLYAELQKIKYLYPEITVDLLLSKNLEDIFMGLDEDSITSIIGIIPVPDNIELEYGVMKDVVDYLLKVETNPQQEVIPIHPDFTAKIVFNSLSDKVANFLKYHRINEYAISDFFEWNSNFAKSELRNVFNGLYNEALNMLPDSEDKNDRVFFYIYEKAYPKHSVAIDSAIFTLMAYYFEYCDIFEALV
ncbi:MAG: ABC-three component system protein [Bacteroidota bacterium]